MCESPLSLQDLCLDCIGEYPEDVFDVVYLPGGSVQFEFKDPDIYLHTELADKLLLKFDEKDMVTDATLNLFTLRNAKLKNVRVRGSKATYKGLKVLEQHKLNEFDCTHARFISLSEILDCLNDYSLANLTRLNVSKCTFRDKSPENLTARLTKLTNLRSLDVSYTDFDQQMLQTICEDLFLLQKLDISATCVQYVTPLLLLRDTLISLNASDLKLTNAMTDTILELELLLHLDISLTHERYDNIQYIAVKDILSHPERLPNLVSLDISGWRVPQTTLEPFVAAHPKLKYLGIMMNPVASEMFISDFIAQRNIMVAGFGSEEQIKNTLRIHKDRNTYVHKALLWLLTFPQNTLSLGTNELIELLVTVMATHTRDYDVQCRGICCIHKLTNGAIKENINLKLMSRAMHIILNAMSFHSNHGELQETALRVLYNEWLLTNVAFNKLRCAVLVMESFNRFDDDIDCISVVICDTLTRLMSNHETMLFGSDAAYMCKFLFIIRERIKEENCDFVMKVIVTMLSTLTDESPETSTTFIDNGGAKLCIQLLEVFKDDRELTHSVLLILNNAAKTAALRCKLMLGSLVGKLMGFMESKDEYIGYFAAGLVAQLASDGEDQWTVMEHSREDILQALETVISDWELPHKMCIFYSSLRPFVRLLQVGFDNRLQMWSLWAIQQMCSENPARYYALLKKEKAVDHLETLVEDGNCSKVVKDACLKLIWTLQASDD